MDNEFFNFDAVIEIEKKESYNQALEDFAKAITEYKPKDEEYISFTDAVVEIKEQFKK